MEGLEIGTRCASTLYAPARSSALGSEREDAPLRVGVNADATGVTQLCVSRILNIEQARATRTSHTIFRKLGFNFRDRKPFARQMR